MRDQPIKLYFLRLPDLIYVYNEETFVPDEGTLGRKYDRDVIMTRYLGEALVNLNMIDTQGGGINRMFLTQVKRFFPMPDYDMTDPERVAVTLRGSILYECYSRLLME